MSIPHRLLALLEINLDFLTCSVMSGNGRRIVGMRTMRTHLGTAPLGWQSMVAIAIVGWFGAVRGTTFLSTCDRLTVSSAILVERTTSSVFVSPGTCSFGLCVFESLRGCRGYAPARFFWRDEIIKPRSKLRGFNKAIILKIRRKQRGINTNRND